MSSDPPASRFRRALLCLWCALLSGAGVWYAGLQVDPPPERHEQDFRLSRSPDDPLELTDAKPVHLPRAFGDFDLYADVELSTGSELDIVFRETSPSVRRGDMPLYHARFGVLRLSTTRAGPPYRTREQALFDGRLVGGQLLEPGRPASVHIEARGRMVRVNVAGVRHAWFEATDAQGSLAFIVRGGLALVTYLELHAIPRRAGVPSWVFGAILGLVAGGLLLALGAALLDAALWLLAVPVGALVAGRLILGFLLPDAEPGAVALLAAGLSGLPLGVLLGARATVLRGSIGIVVMLGLWEATARLEVPRLEPLEDPRLSAYFGWGSGSAPYDALARRLSARAVVHVPRAPEPGTERVMFLGGGDLFEARTDAYEAGYLGWMAVARASRELGHKLEAVVVPTLYSNSLQQLVLFERFYVETYRPRVVVFAVPPGEGEARERFAPRDVLEGRAPVTPLFGSMLVRLWALGLAPEVPGTDAADLGRTLDELAVLAGRYGFEVIVMDGPDLAPELTAAVGPAVVRHGFVRVEDQLVPGGPIPVEPLAAALVELLR